MKNNVYTQEYIDKRHLVSDDFYDILERKDFIDKQTIIKDLTRLIEKDPFFFESYTELYKLLKVTENTEQAKNIIENGYSKCKDYLINETGGIERNISYSYVDNRHILRVFFHFGEYLWENLKKSEGLEIFRTIFAMDPEDKMGIRYFILAILMNLSFKDFNRRFIKKGYFSNKIETWFKRHYKKFYEDFSYWDRNYNLA